MIDVVNCTHYYGVRPVLKNVNLHIDAGQLVTIMGPNGVGKSTLVTLMAGIQIPTFGYVEIDGKRRRQSRDVEAAIRRMVAYLPTDVVFPTAPNAGEWLLAIGKLYGHDELHVLTHIDQLAEIFELKDLLENPVGSLSAGQRKKVALSAALITEAPILLLDEPFSGGLDPVGIAALKKLLIALRDRRRSTIVMTTPVPELVEELSDKIAVLRDAELIAFDSVANLRNQSGANGNLEQIYARLVSPEHNVSVDRYVRERL
jgi:ABC-2 type transport system ATP-binding protein